MKKNPQIKNLENAINELRRTAKDIKHKKTRNRIERTIAKMEESKNKILNPKPKRSFKSLYMVTIPFTVIFILVGIYYFTRTDGSQEL